MKGSQLNRIAVFLSILIIIYWLYTLRREKFEGSVGPTIGPTALGEYSKAVKYVSEASPEKFLNPYIVYGFASELTDDEDKLARVIPLVKMGDREKLIKYLESL
jgi:hypothetical protein